MLKEIDLNDAQAKFFEILRRVEAGESYIITNDGRPIAEVSPADSSINQDIQKNIDDILNFTKLIVSFKELLELKSEGRK